MKTILSILICLCVGFANAQDADRDKDFSTEQSSFSNEDLLILNKVEIYPNPSVKYLIVEIKNSELYNVEFEMRSIIGNKLNVMAENIGADKYRFNVKRFAPGYYFIVIKDDNTQFKQAHKFLKK
jgi:hypothetical protein